MDIRNLIVKEYLESLTEKDELNRIFPLLLEARDFQILSKPTEYLGISEYGKDIVAIGIDEDGIKKRFYFELKGGSDRNITEKNYYGEDGIQDSLTQASFQPFVSAHPEFNDLPLKVVIVHNGIVKGSVQSILENVLVQYTAKTTNTTFDRWDISKLTLLFSEHLFGPYLLVDKVNTRLFNRVLINLESYEGISPDFIELLHKVLSQNKWNKSNKRILSRQWKLAFETLRLLAFVIYSESKQYNNLDIAKRYIAQLVLVFWQWSLKNKLEATKGVRDYFDSIARFYFQVLDEYFKRILPLVTIREGIFSEEVGRYESVGYTMRTFGVIEYFMLFVKMNRDFNTGADLNVVKRILVELLVSNNVCTRPLLDIHSIPITDILKFFIEQGELEMARGYLQNVLINLYWAKNSHNRLPDANNSIENVIKLFASYEKSVYYSDSTSPLLTVLMEFTAILDLETEYYQIRDFILKHKIDLGIFVPHHGKNSTSKSLIRDTENDLEEQLFAKSFTDGYQSELRLTTVDFEQGRIDEPLDFESFKAKIDSRRNEFEYDYRTEKAGYAFLIDLAHIFYKTPYFPDTWRFLIS